MLSTRFAPLTEHRIATLSSTRGLEIKKTAKQLLILTDHIGELKIFLTPRCHIVYEKDCRSEQEEKCQTVTETITQQQCQMINEKICNTINEQSCNTVRKLEY